jgi:AcrR family transcriptional regulator
VPGKEKQSKSEGGDEAPSSLWERLGRPAPAPRAALTPERIAAAAVAIADAEGIGAVTMRRLAAELGTAPMAAYRYVRGKDELLELMLDHVYGELDLPGDTPDWQAALRAVALRKRALMLKHPWMTQTFVRTPTPNQLAVPEHVLAALDGVGVDADTRMAAIRTVTAYVDGTVAAEIGLSRLMRDRGWSDSHETRAGLAPLMTWLMDTGRYPAYRRYMDEATHKDDPRWEFEVGLDCVLDGIAARMGI